MAVPLCVLLILTGVTGTYSLTAVSKISVKAGASVSIPCLYDQQYRNHVKYLCNGYYWRYCKYVIKTNEPETSGKFLITDDEEQTTFTVTIKQLTKDDKDFWCAVEINNGPDVKIYFQLSVKNNLRSLYVHRQYVTGFIGDDVTINCNYRNYGEMKWCRLGGECVTKSPGEIDGTTVTIDESVPNVFAVTMSGLRPEDSGWYFCSKGDFQMPVHLNIKEKRITTAETVTEGGITTNTTSFTEAKTENSAPFDLMTLVIPLSALVLIVIAVLFIWIMLKKRSNGSSAVVGQSRTDAKTTKSKEEEVTYSDVFCKRKHSVQGVGHESDADVTYSSVVTVKKENVERNEAKEEDVTYSTLA